MGPQHPRRPCERVIGDDPRRRARWIREMVLKKKTAQGLLRGAERAVRQIAELADPFYFALKRSATYCRRHPSGVTNENKTEPKAKRRTTTPSGGPAAAPVLEISSGPRAELSDARALTGRPTSLSTTLWRLGRAGEFPKRAEDRFRTESPGAPLKSTP